MLNEQISLHTRIEQEAIEYANQFKYGIEYRKAAYVDGAASYIAKLQAAEEKAARYEKALKEIRKWELTTGSMIKVKHLDILKDIMQTVNKALTPKTGEDELHTTP